MIRRQKYEGHICVRENVVLIDKTAQNPVYTMKINSFATVMSCYVTFLELKFACRILRIFYFIGVKIKNKKDFSALRIEIFKL